MSDNKPQLYVVKTEVLAPVELTFKVWAKDPEQAIEMTNRAGIDSHKLKSRGKKKKATVYRFGYSNIELQKNF